MMFRKKSARLGSGADRLREPASGASGWFREHRAVLGGSCGDPGGGMDKGLWVLGVGVHRPGLLVGSTVKWWGRGGPF